MGLNPAEGTYIRVLCVVSGHCSWLVTCIQSSTDYVYVTVCDAGTSTVRWPSPELGYCAIGSVPREACIY